MRDYHLPVDAVGIVNLPVPGGIRGEVNCLVPVGRGGSFLVSIGFKIGNGGNKIFPVPTGNGGRFPVPNGVNLGILKSVPVGNFGILNPVPVGSVGILSSVPAFKE